MLRARETVGSNAKTSTASTGAGARHGVDSHRRDDGGAAQLGKRKREGGFGAAGIGRPTGDEVGSSEDDMQDLDEETRRIPMPRDTPPPIAKEVLDRWYARRRARLGLPPREQRRAGGRGGDAASRGQGANAVPLGATERLRGNTDARVDGETAVPRQEAQTVYEAKPVVRDLRKEASRFVPAAVREKMERARGLGGGLVEPEEADRLEREGYALGGPVKEGQRGKNVAIEEVEDEDAG